MECLRILNSSWIFSMNFIQTNGNMITPAKTAENYLDNNFECYQCILVLTDNNSSENK